MVYMLLLFVLRAFAIEDFQDEVDKLRCALILANINNSIESAISLKLDSKLEFVTRQLVELKTEFKALNGKIKIGALGVRICEFDVRIGALDGRNWSTRRQGWCA